jgi:hypothetical protein
MDSVRIAVEGRMPDTCVELPTFCGAIGRGRAGEGERGHRTQLLLRRLKGMYSRTNDPESKQ